MPVPPRRTTSSLFDRSLRRFTFEGRVRGEIGFLLTLIFVSSILAAILGRHVFDFSSVLLVPARVLHVELWRLFTWALVETGPLELIFACLAIYWFGGELAGTWGARKFLTIYFVLAVVVAALTTLLALLDADILGAVYSGVVPLVSALLVAWGFTFPDREMYLVVFRITGRFLAGFTILFAIARAAYLGWESVLPELLAIALLLAYVYRGRFRRAPSGKKPARPSHLHAVRDDEKKWH